MIKWLIQSSNLNTYNMFKIIEILKNNNFEYSNFGVIPFTNIITNLENILENPNDKYIIKGGTKILQIFQEIKKIEDLNEHLSKKQINNGNEYLNTLKNGIFYDIEKFDQKYYKNFDLPLLNENAYYLPYKDYKYQQFNKPMFIKPSRDLKAFEAGIIYPEETIESYIKGKPFQSFVDEETIIISELVEIIEEYRFFIINKKVITGSLYMKNKIFECKNIDNDKTLITIANEFAKLYQPHDIFTLDIAKIKNSNGFDYKIIEYNCFNCSGIYETNFSKMANEIQNYLNHFN